MGRTLTFVLCATLMLPGAAPADPAETPGPGTRVRLTVPEVADEPLVGRLTAVEPGSVVLVVSGRVEPVVVPRDLVRKWEVSRGLKSNVGRGAARGLLFGAAVGLGLGAWAYADGTYNNAALPMLSGATLFGGIGAGIGALVGRGKSERWDEVEQPTVSIGLMPVPGGGVGLSVSWSPGGR